MRPHLARLSRDTIIYGLGGAAARYSGLLLLPIYTRAFSPADYGILESILNLTTLLLVLVGLGVDGALPLLYYATDDAATRRRLGALWLALVPGVAGPVTVLLLAGAGAVALAATGDAANAPLFALGLAALPFSLGLIVCTTLLRLAGRPGVYALLNFSLTTTTAALSIALVLGGRLGVAGALGGTLGGTVLVGLAGVWAARDLLGWRAGGAAGWPLLGRLLRLGLPLVPAGLALWAINFSNTYFLIQLSGEGEAGVFRVGARVAALLGLAVWAFQLAWTPFSLALAARPEAPRTYARVALWYSAGAVGLALLLAAVAPALLAVLAPPAYGGAAAVIGLLALSSAAQGAYYVLAIGVNLAQRTGHIAWTTIAAAAASGLLNALLIPRWGLLGAGAAALCANLLTMTLIYGAAQRVWPLPYPAGRLAAVWAVGVGGCGLISVLYAAWPPSWALVGGVSSAGMLAYAAFLLAASIITRGDLAAAGHALAALRPARRPRP